MDCPRCRFAAPRDASQCAFCGWQLSRAFTRVTSTSIPAPVGPSLPAAGRGSVLVPSPHDWKASGQAADALMFTPTPFTASSAPLGAPRAEAPGLSAADAFILVPPTPSVRRAGQVPARRSWRRRPSWLSKLRGSNLAAARHPELRRGELPRLEVIEMPVMQTAFDFPAAEETSRGATPAGAVASLELRARAGLFDALLVLLASAFFFTLFAVLGGEPSFGRPDLLIYLLANFALAAAYFGLFTVCGGRTPGMQTYGLHAVTFEAQPLPAERAVWRAIGYLVSIASLGLGFLWGALDDRRLTWHDHVSATFLTDRPSN